MGTNQRGGGSPGGLCSRQQLTREKRLTVSHSSPFYSLNKTNRQFSPHPGWRNTHLSAPIMIRREINNSSGWHQQRKPWLGGSLLTSGTVDIHEKKHQHYADTKQISSTTKKLSTSRRGTLLQLDTPTTAQPTQQILTLQNLNKLNINIFFCNGFSGFTPLCRQQSGEFFLSLSQQTDGRHSNGCDSYPSLHKGFLRQTIPFQVDNRPASHSSSSPLTASDRRHLQRAKTWQTRARHNILQHKGGRLLGPRPSRHWFTALVKLQERWVIFCIITSSF